MQDRKLFDPSCRHVSLSLVIQAAGVIGTLAVFAVMYLQLAAIRDEQAMTLRPYITLGVEMGFSNVGQDNEIWELTYILQNVGQFPAQNVHYKVEHTAARAMNVPSAFDNTDPIMIPPYGGISPVFTTYPRSEVIRIQKGSDRVYRHIYVQYEDARGNKYFSQSTWILSGYDVGLPVMWQLVKSGGS
jgi:hypothetical protein